MSCRSLDLTLRPYVSQASQGWPPARLVLGVEILFASSTHTSDVARPPLVKGTNGARFAMNPLTLAEDVREGISPENAPLTPGALH